MKRGVLFIFVFLLLFLITMVYAQERDISSFDKNAQLSVGAGITPDSPFYFLDTFFSRFGDNAKLREEKIAEIKAMIKEGKINEAKIALEGYNKYANALEKDVSPEETNRTRTSAAAIYNTLQEIKDQIPNDEKNNFVNRIVNKEESIITASEISSKIKELCKTLSTVDPLEYSRVCKIENDSADWKKKLNQELTAQQKQDAQKFSDIMSQCFKTSGQQCKCEEIPFTEFAKACSTAAPLATACKINNDESACEKLNSLELPELPFYLQSVMDSLQGQISDAQFELHVPKECRDAEITNPKECMKIMIRIHAPPECKDALIKANIQNENEARDVCQKIMFDLHAPQECKDAGITDYKECAKILFQSHAPKECIEAGLTGEQKSDQQKCKEIMQSLGKGRGAENGFGNKCRQIENPEERLKCYDSALSGVQFQNFERRGPENGFPEQCRKANALTKESCEQIMRQFSESQRKIFEIHQNQTTAQFVKPLCNTGETLICDSTSGCKCVAQGTTQLVNYSPTYPTTSNYTSPSTTTITNYSTVPSTTYPTASSNYTAPSTTTTSPTTTYTAPTTTTPTYTYPTGHIISDNSFLNYYFR